jgi:hypothetical protein
MVLLYHCSLLISSTNKCTCFLFQDIPGCGKFRKQCLQNVEELEICYDSITNIDIDHWSSRMDNASTNIQQGDTQDDAFNCETQGDCGEDGGTNGSEEASPINANGKILPRFTQDKGKKHKIRTSLIIREAVSSMLCQLVLMLHKKKENILLMK